MTRQRELYEQNEQFRREALALRLALDERTAALIEMPDDRNSLADRVWELEQQLRVAQEVHVELLKVIGYEAARDLPVASPDQLALLARGPA